MTTRNATKNTKKMTRNATSASALPVWPSKWGRVEVSVGCDEEYEEYGVVATPFGRIASYQIREDVARRSARTENS